MENSAFKLKRELYQRLSSLVMNTDEKVEPAHIFNTENGPLYCADFFLESGCNALKIEGPAVIEVKKRPLFDTVSQNKKIFQKLKRNDDLKTFLLAVDEANDYVKISGIRRTGFGVVSVNGLCDKIEKATNPAKVLK